MNTKKILLITLIAIAILVSVSVVSAGLFDGLFKEEQKDDVVELDNITFNTTNVTKFNLLNESNENYGHIKWYRDENKIGYNVHIYNYSKSNTVNKNSALTMYKSNNYNNLPSQTVNGVVVYTTSANSGDRVGEPRYVAIVENRDLKTIVDFWSPDPNETAKMALSLKFK